MKKAFTIFALVLTIASSAFSQTYYCEVKGSSLGELNTSIPVDFDRLEARNQVQLGESVRVFADSNNSFHFVPTPDGFALLILDSKTNKTSVFAFPGGQSRGLVIHGGSPLKSFGCFLQP